MLLKCGWCHGNQLYEEYHDNEWGVPVYEDKILFELLVLETFQAGLSWLTILKKREHFRKAFDNFNYNTIATYNTEKITALLNDTGIVRNTLKINATVTNAKAFINVQDELGSFSNYIWKFVDGKPIKNSVTHYKEAPASTALSNVISKDLKKRGFKFVGPTVVYAYMQAVGIVNDHEIGCYRYDAV